MGKTKPIAPVVGVRFYQGEEDLAESLEVLSLGTTKNEVMKTALKEYVTTQNQKDEERKRTD